MAKSLFDIISLVCSVGNFPLAAARWKGGISFGGVISLIVTDRFRSIANRNRRGGGEGYAVDPVCGMQVGTADAPATAMHEGHRYFFCSDRCRERFDAGQQSRAGSVDRAH